MMYRDAWDDPNVKSALQCRGPSHVFLICCQTCHNWGYYNEGNHFSCSVEGCSWSCSGEELESIIDNQEVISLDGYLSSEFDNYEIENEN